MKKTLGLVLVLLVLAGGGYLFFNFYSFIFAKRVNGVVEAVERVAAPMAVLQNGANMSSQVFSFAVAIRDKKSGEIITASSEDRQWAVVQKGQCVDALFYVYPPWEIQKWGTYYNARMDRLFDCDK